MGKRIRGKRSHVYGPTHHSPRIQKKVSKGRKLNGFEMQCLFQIIPQQFWRRSLIAPSYNAGPVRLIRDSDVLCGESGRQTKETLWICGI